MAVNLQVRCPINCLLYLNCTKKIGKGAVQKTILSSHEFLAHWTPARKRESESGIIVLKDISLRFIARSIVLVVIHRAIFHRNARKISKSFLVQVVLVQWLRIARALRDAIFETIAQDRFWAPIVTIDYVIYVVVIDISYADLPFERIK